MTPEAQRIAIAKALGWTHITQNRSDEDWYGQVPGAEMLDSQGALENLYLLPNYTSDLNAMHEAEATLTTQQKEEFASELYGNSDIGTLVDDDGCTEWLTLFQLTHRSASQRAEAFLRTLSLWEEGSPEPIKP